MLPLVPFSLVFFGVIWLAVLGCSTAAMALPWSVADLQCDAQRDPLATASTVPQLRWIVQSESQNQGQTAFQILVATQPQRLNESDADLWSARVNSASTRVVYAGKPLAPGQTVYWSVRSWNRSGDVSAWSAPARFTVGLSDELWQGQWIGFDAPRQACEAHVPLRDAKWIWHAADAAPVVGSRVFVTPLRVPPDAGKIVMVATADDSMTVAIDGQQIYQTPPGSDTWRRPAEIDLTSFARQGDHEIRIRVENKGAQAGLIAQISRTRADQEELLCVTDARWTSIDLGDDWKTADVSAARPAKVIASFGDQPWGKVMVRPLLPPPVLLRRSFVIDQPVAQALLYYTAEGIADLRLNGRPVSGDYFNPGWTDYPKRLHYRAYDVTSLLSPGANALGATLADGWFAGHVGWGRQRDHYGQHTRLLAQLRLTFADGSSQIIVTDPTWKASIGPLVYADFLQGEYHDARNEIPGWDAPGFNDAAWHAVNVGGQLKTRLEPHPGPAVVNFATVPVQEITQPRPGVYVLNLGQNFAGVYRFNLRGERGQKITLKFAERLNPDGTAYTTNLRSAASIDTYVCKGDGVETFSPRFTFHGFQYVQIEGLTHAPDRADFVGLPLSSDTPLAGSFNCSDPMLNRLWSNAYWTQRANFIDVPTDCPQRDERLGWTGDAQVYVRAAALHTDIEAFFTKWLIDLEDGQRADGQFPMVAPLKVAGDDGGPAWSEAGVICPWVIYDKYNNRTVLERHYASMKKYVDFLVARSTPELLPPAKYHCFGDWLNIKAETPHDVIYMAYFAHATDLLVKSAQVLGKSDDAAKYADVLTRVKNAFNDKYVKPDGRIEGNTQCCYVLAIAYDLLDAEKTKLAGQYLVDDIQQRHGCLSTGFVGTKDIMHALSKVGRNDVAFELLHNTQFPSWGFSIVNGATSIWERWNGWTPEQGFGDPGMNSFAHYAYGAVTQWMVETIGGIKNGSPGYETIVLEPVLDPKLTFADVIYDSVAGRIESHWKREGQTVKFTFVVPANTTATMILPGKAPETVGSGRYERGIE